MRNLLKFLIHYHVTFLFIVLEVISFTITIQNNFYQRASFINNTTEISGNIYRIYSSVVEYFNVRNENDKLALENTALRKLLKSNYIINDKNIQQANDLIYKQKYDYINAKVINNSVFRQTNYITLNKGRNQGIKPDMGVINSQGIVGIVKDVSYNFSIVIPTININAHISAKIKKNNYFGTLSWDGKDYRYALLNEIPFHVKVSKGDTVVTSGYSSIFPEGITIGVVKDFNFNQGNNFYNIYIQLSTDFMNLNHVNVVSNLYKDEQKILENSVTHD
ncbi:MAG: rod shape-determining protein MreC [Bacteroidetes bacterium GWA2_32_17]|nr:MAG: rod shape-determining protein MreC [Bacteroidetes bacterium GWA2_32_17]